MSPLIWSGWKRTSWFRNGAASKGRWSSARRSARLKRADLKSFLSWMANRNQCSAPATSWSSIASMPRLKYTLSFEASCGERKSGEPCIRGESGGWIPPHFNYYTDKVPCVTVWGAVPEPLFSVPLDQVPAAIWLSLGELARGRDQIPGPCLGKRGLGRPFPVRGIPPPAENQFQNR